jgi:hypothetical protein
LKLADRFVPATHHAHQRDLALRRSLVSLFRPSPLALRWLHHCRRSRRGLYLHRPALISYAPHRDHVVSLLLCSSNAPLITDSSTIMLPREFACPHCASAKLIPA